jgi:hypothetical protein
MIHTRNVWRTLVNSMPESQVLESENAFQPISVMGDNPTPGTAWRGQPVG